MTPRADILRRAEALITGDREADYGPPAESFARAAALWSAYLGQHVTARQVCVCMTLLKITRLAHQPGHEDSTLDAIAYLALSHEMTGA
jgi:hypothetical protein